ncbi:MAG: cation:proton antiporter [Bacillota bacterium]|jgi:Kef-type K+ transport system membrane component KefB|nr:hypothetical protein [Bacillota bacterium]
MISVLAVGLVMLASAVVGGVVAALGFSSAAGYILAGMAVGQLLPGLREAVTPAGMALAADIGLGLIAFVVGGELEASRLRGFPRGAMGMAFGQALACVILISAVTVALGFRIELGLALGAIAATTSPASTVLVTRRLRAGGQLTNALLSVVAINDALCLLLFSVVLAVARALAQWAVSQSLLGMAGIVLWEVFGSLLVGSVAGIALAYFIRQVRGGDELTVVLVGAVLLASGLSDRMHTSPVIACLVFGAVVTNLVMGSRRLFAAIDRFSAPLYVLVLALAGVTVQTGQVLGAGVLLAAYVAMRVVGKVSGAGLAGRFVQAEASVRRFLGLCLTPHAGLATGLVLAASGALPEQAGLMAAVVVPGVLAFEAVGLRIVETCLTKAGEAQGDTRSS